MTGFAQPLGAGEEGSSAPALDTARDRRYSDSVMASQHIDAILANLRAAYPDARYELEWSTPVQMLVATILAAQCTDERVNKVTKTLFVTYPDSAAFAAADREELETAIKSTGFFRQKAKTILAACADLCERFEGEVPETMAELVTLPGVARKTANVVMATCFDHVPAAGVIVDTHVRRMSQRLGLSKQKQGDKVERDLMALIPEGEWAFFGLAMVLFGRYVCTSKKPTCSTCSMADFCPKLGVKDAT